MIPGLPLGALIIMRMMLEFQAHFARLTAYRHANASISSDCAKMNIERRTRLQVPRRCIYSIQGDALLLLSKSMSLD